MKIVTFIILAVFGFFIGMFLATPKQIIAGESLSVCAVSPTETISASPSAIPASTPSMGGTGNVPSNPHTDTTQAPGSPTCSIPFTSPILQGFHIVKTVSIQWSWWPVSGVDKYSIIYGYSPDSLIYGEDNIPATSTSIIISNLDFTHPHDYAQVWAWEHGCVEKSTILDPKL